MFKTLRRWWQRRTVNSANTSTPSEQDIEAIHQPSNQSSGEWVAYDEDLLERSRTQWQFGDWETLAAISRETLQHHPDRAKLALLAAAGHQQQGDMAAARQFTGLAQDWGASKKLISQVLISGVYNTLGRASTIGGYKPRALKHFENAVATANPNGDLRLFVQARTREELIRVSNNCELNNKLSLFDRNDSDLFSSASYWEKRYKSGGTSGHGSYGKLAEFKAEVLNRFIEYNDIKSLIELGCGDGNQLSLLNVSRYTGLDISGTAIKKCKNKYNFDDSRKFFTVIDFLAKPFKSEATISLDVIFHLVEDDVYKEYMEILFSSSENHVVIYSSNSEDMIDPAKHVKHRKFTDFVEREYKNWRLQKIVHNRHPHDGSINPKDLSFSNFYFYENIKKMKDNHE